ncbi:unnamed protein product, partial [Rotaria magnacalcarata]
MRSSALLKQIAPLVSRTWYHLSSVAAHSELVLHTDPVLPVIDFSSFA